MKKIYYEDYHKMHNRSKISIKLSPEERALLDVWRHEDGWENVSGFIKYRLFGYDKTPAKLRAVLRKKDNESTKTALIPVIESLINYYRFVITACEKEIARYADINESDVHERLKAVRRWMDRLCKRTLDVFCVLANIANGLDIDTRFLTRDGLKACWFSREYELFGAKTIFLTGYIAAIKHCWISDVEDCYYVNVISTVKTVEKEDEDDTERMVEELKYSCTCKTLDLTLRLDDRVAVYGHFIPGVTKNKDGKKAFALVVYSAHITKMDSV